MGVDTSDTEMVSGRYPRRGLKMLKNIGALLCAFMLIAFSANAAEETPPLCYSPPEVRDAIDLDIGAGKYESAQLLFVELYACHLEQAAEAAVALGHIAMIRENFAEAIKYYRHAVVLEPDNIGYQSDLIKAEERLPEAQ